MNWDSVRSREIAETYCKTGQLEKSLLMPRELGGEDIPENATYLPPDARQEKDRAVLELVALVSTRRVTQISITPAYRNASLVPSTIEVVGLDDRNSTVHRAVVSVW